MRHRPRVPFYRYKQLFREIEPIMECRGTPIYDLTLHGLSPRGGLTPEAAID